MTALLLLGAWLQAAPPTGLPAVDAARAAGPTTSDTEALRLAAVNAWYRLLLNRGADLTALEPAVMALRAPAGSPERRRAIDQALTELERLQAEPPLIPEVRGPREPLAGTPTPWPGYAGGPRHTGATADPGPSEGVIDWRLPLGDEFRAAPLVDGDQVIVATPGMHSAMACYDLADGHERWRARQYGTDYHTPPRSNGTPERAGERIVGRAITVEREALQFILVDPRRGEVTRRLPVAPEPEPWPARAAEPDGVWLIAATAGRTRVTVRNGAGRLWWSHATGPQSSEPVRLGDRVYVATRAGELHALNLLGTNRVAWTVALRAAATMLAAGAERLYAGDNEGRLTALDPRPEWVMRADLATAEPRAKQLFAPVAEAGERLYVAGADRRLACLERGTGRLIWRADVPDWVRAKPLVAGDRVVVADVGGTVTAFALGDQPRQVWQTAASEFPILADPAFGGGLVLVTSGGYQLVALALEDGRIAWRRALLEGVEVDGRYVPADAPPVIQQSSPTVAAGRVVVGSPSRFVVAADALTGRRLWRFEAGGPVTGAPTQAEGMVFVAAGYGHDEGLEALDAATGRPLWRQPVGPLWPPVTSHHGWVTVANRAGLVLNLRSGDGEVLWRRQLGDGCYTPLAADNRHIYVGSWDGAYYALGLFTGSVQWSYARPGWPYATGGRPDSAAPVIAGDLLLVQVLGGALVALDRGTGAERWAWWVPPGYLQNGTPAVTGDRVVASRFLDAYTTPSGAALQALDLATGRPLWSWPDGGGITAVAAPGERILTASLSSPYVTCLETPGGRPVPRWRTRLGAPVGEAGPAIWGDRAYVAAIDGVLYALR